VKHKSNDYLSPLQVLRLIATTNMKQSPLDDVTLLGNNGNYDIVICRNNVKVYSHSKETTLCNEYYLEEIVNLDFEEEDQ
jgi:hypothetical protein